MSKPSVELWLELETRCNLACKFCYNYWKDGSAGEPERRSSGETIAALRMLFEAVHCTQVAFSGGEPLLRSDLLDLIRVAHSYNAPVILTTNGTLLTEARIRDLIAAGVQTFQIPLHSHLAEMHDNLSGIPSWRKSLAAMIRVRESGSALTPVFVATALNLSHFPHVIQMLGQIGVSQIIFNRFIPTGLGTLFRKEIGVPGEADLIRTLHEADSVAGAHGIRIYLGTPVQVPSSDSADWRNIELASCPVEEGQRRWTVSADLNIRRCNQSAASIGNVTGRGLERLLSELQLPAPDHKGVIRSCNFLARPSLVQIGSAS